MRCSSFYSCPEYGYSASNNGTLSLMPAPNSKHSASKCNAEQYILLEQICNHWSILLWRETKIDSSLLELPGSLGLARAQCSPYVLLFTTIRGLKIYYMAVADAAVILSQQAHFSGTCGNLLLVNWWVWSALLPGRGSWQWKGMCFPGYRQEGLLGFYVFPCIKSSPVLSDCMMFTGD